MLKSVKKLQKGIYINIILIIIYYYNIEIIGSKDQKMLQ